ncbi:hypothetical protein D9M69_503230 [compost metagenome]
MLSGALFGCGRLPESAAFHLTTSRQASGDMRVLRPRYSEIPLRRFASSPCGGPRLRPGKAGSVARPNLCARATANGACARAHRYCPVSGAAGCIAENPCATGGGCGVWMGGGTIRGCDKAQMTMPRVDASPAARQKHPPASVGRRNPTRTNHLCPHATNAKRNTTPSDTRRRRRVT